jgi:hypothetical protein
MAPEPLSRRRYRCCYCGAELPAWLPAARAPSGALLLHHLSVMHPDQVAAYLDQMPTDEDHTRVIVEAYEVVETREAEKP